MNHMEGGWPKDIDPTEKDQTARYRKKVSPLLYGPLRHTLSCADTLSCHTSCQHPPVPPCAAIGPILSP
jgi:hypothetical protein